MKPLTLIFGIALFTLFSVQVSAQHQEESLLFSADKKVNISSGSLLSNKRDNATFIKITQQEVLIHEGGSRKIYPIYLNISDDGLKREILCQDGTRITVYYSGKDEVRAVAVRGQDIIKYSN